MASGGLDPGMARAEDAEEFDAFNDDTFGDGGGAGDEWSEDAHEALAAITEEEMKAVQGRSLRSVQSSHLSTLELNVDLYRKSVVKKIVLFWSDMTFRDPSRPISNNLTLRFSQNIESWRNCKCS